MNGGQNGGKQFGCRTFEKRRGDGAPGGASHVRGNMRKLYQILPQFFFYMRKVLVGRTMAYGINYGQPKMLDYLYHHDGCMQKDFAVEFSMEPPTVSSVLRTMENRGLLRRERSSSSARVVNVYITEKGKEVQHYLQDIYDQLEEQCFEGFTEAERQAFYESLEKIYANLQKYRS